METSRGLSFTGRKNDSPIASEDTISPNRSIYTNTIESKDRLSISKEKMRQKLFPNEKPSFDGLNINSPRERLDASQPIMSRGLPSMYVRSEMDDTGYPQHGVLSPTMHNRRNSLNVVGKVAQRRAPLQSKHLTFRQSYLMS